MHELTSPIDREVMLSAVEVMKTLLAPTVMAAKDLSHKVCKFRSTVVESELPHLEPITRLYHGMESTSCQVERIFSALALLVSNLHTPTLPAKVEKIMFLKLNQPYLPEA